MMMRLRIKDTIVWINDDQMTIYLVFELPDKSEIVWGLLTLCPSLEEEQRLDLASTNYCISKILEITGVDTWDQIIGKYIYANVKDKKIVHLMTQEEKN